MKEIIKDKVGTILNDMMNLELFIENMGTGLDAQNEQKVIRLLKRAFKDVGDAMDILEE